MDNTIFELISSGVEEYVKPLGFETTEDGRFKKEGLEFSIAYKEESKSFVLLCNEEGAEDKVLAAWLFDETHRKKDAEIIAEDFCDTIRAKLGIEKAKPTVSADNVALPIRAKQQGDTLSMEQFVQRFLAVYPQYKDEYKDNVAAYGGFLPLDFFKKFGVEKIRELAQSGSPKQIDKMLSMLNEFYCQGDKQLGGLIISVFFGGAFCKDAELFAQLAEGLKEYPFLNVAANESVKVAAKNKKFKELF